MAGPFVAFAGSRRQRGAISLRGATARKWGPPGGCWMARSRCESGCSGPTARSGLRG